MFRNPSNPQSLNRYSYVLNNPLKYIDPSGHQPEDPQLDLANSIIDDPDADPEVLDWAYNYKYMQQRQSVSTSPGGESSATQIEDATPVQKTGDQTQTGGGDQVAPPGTPTPGNSGVGTLGGSGGTTGTSDKASGGTSSATSSDDSPRGAGTGAWEMGVGLGLAFAGAAGLRISVPLIAAGSVNPHLMKGGLWLALGSALVVNGGFMIFSRGIYDLTGWTGAYNATKPRSAE